MRRILATLTGATALMGVGMGAPAPASAQTIITGPFDAAATVVSAPFVAATDIGGAVIGAPVAAAWGTYPGYYAPGYPDYYATGYTEYWGGPPPVGTSYGGEPYPQDGAAAPAHGAIALPVYGQVGPCYYTHERIRGIWHRARVCR